MIRPGALGDALLTRPLLRAVIAGGAGSVLVAGTPAAWQWLQPDAPVSVVDLGSRAWLGLFGGRETQALRDAVASADPVVLCLREAAHARQALAGLGARRIVCVAPPPRGATAVGGWPHAAVALAQALSLPAPVLDEPWPDPWILPPPTARADAAARLAAAGLVPARTVLLHAGAGSAAKCWPAADWAALAARLGAHGLDAVLVEGPADAAACAAVEAATVVLGQPPPLRLRGLSLRDLAATIAVAFGFVGHDSGPSHLAAAIAPCVSLFAATDAAVWAPRGRRAQALTAADVDWHYLDPERVFSALLGCCGDG